MPTIQFRVAPALHEKLVAICERRGQTVSAFFQALSERVANHADDVAYNPDNPPPSVVAVTQPLKRLSTGVVGFSTTGEPITARMPYQKGLKSKKGEEGTDEDSKKGGRR